MANNDRDRRLLDASGLHDAINALSKVKEEQRIEFIHDRMMSAIDDICKSHQGTGKERFSAAQVVILKDIIFHVIYVLDPKTRPNRGFLGRLWEEYRSLGPLKQVGIAFTVCGVLFGAGVSAFHTAAPWVTQLVESIKPATIQTLGKSPAPGPQTESGPSAASTNPPAGSSYTDVVIRNTAYGNQSNQDIKATSTKLGLSLLTFEKTRRENLDAISNSSEASVEGRRSRLNEYDAKSRAEFQQTLLPEVRDVQIELVKRNEAKVAGSARVPLTGDALQAINSGILMGPSPLEGVATYLRTLSDKL